MTDSDCFIFLLKCRSQKVHYNRVWQFMTIYKKYKPGGLNLSCRDIDWESRSWHWEKVHISSYKKLVSTVEISWPRLRNLNFVSTPLSSPKSLDQDREICRDLNFLANLDSLSRSWSRVSQFYHFSQSRFLNLSRFLSLKSFKYRYWDILTNLENLDSLNLSEQSRWKSWSSQVSIQKSQF